MNDDILSRPEIEHHRFESGRLTDDSRAESVTYSGEVIAGAEGMTASVRALWKAPGFSALTIVILAFGIGISTAFFSVVDAVLLQPLRSDASGRIVAIQTRWPAKGQVSPRVSGGDFLDLRSALHSFSAVAVYAGGQIGVQTGGTSRFANTFKADPSFFSVLDIPVVAGHLPSARDAEASQDAVVTASFARASWGGLAIGRTLRVDNKPYSVIAIVNNEYAFPEGAEVWITGPKDPENQNHTAFNYRAIGRLRPATSLTQAAAELAHIREKDRTFHAVSLREDVVGPATTTLLFLFAATALLLLIACANVANLTLTRTAKRSHEIAIRISLGSSLKQLLGFLVAESLVLTVAATAGGVAFAYFAIHAIAPLLPESVPRSGEVLQMHPKVLVFAIVSGCLTVLICGVVPWVYLRSVGLADVLKQTSGRRLAGGGQGIRQIVVAAQVALSCVLCIGAVLLSRSLMALDDAPLGFHSANVAVMYADAPAVTLAEYMRAIETFESVITTFERIPSVHSAAAVMGLPTGRYGSNGSYWAEGIDTEAGQDPFKSDFTGRVLPHANFTVATAGYFKTVGIPLLAGRDFNDDDRYDRSFTAIISKSLARHSFGSADPIGRRIYCGLDSPKPMTVVGIVGDVRQDSPASGMEPAIYMPLSQHPYYANEVEVVARSDGDPRQLIPAMRQVVQKVAPGVATEFTTLSEMVSKSITTSRFEAVLCVVFAALAAVLAMAGIYAVMLLHVSQQRTEVGVRMALGAAPRSIMWLVMRRAFLMCSVGLIVGMAAAAALSRFISDLVYGVAVLDPTTYYLAAAAVIGSVMAAAAGPTWRASRTDPAVALRSE